MTRCLLETSELLRLFLCANVWVICATVRFDYIGNGKATSNNDATESRLQINVFIRDIYSIWVFCVARF